MRQCRQFSATSMMACVVAVAVCTLLSTQSTAPHCSASTEALFCTVALRFQVVHLCNGVKFPQRVRYQHMNSREWRCRRSHVQVHAPELGPNPRARSLLQGTITLASCLYGDKQGTHKVMLPPTLRQLSGSAQVAVGWLLLISVQETKLAKSGYGAIAWLPDTEV